MIPRKTKKLKIKLPYDTIIPLLGIHPKKKKKPESRILKRYLHTHIHSSIFQEVETTQVFINGQMDKQNVVHMYNYSALKRKKILTYATIRMNFENIRNEISQSQKEK